ncbi:MAG: hypothetical protein QM703_11675 [Gemmatales bacterium]
MRRILAIILCLSILVIGCKSQPPGEFPEPNWLERRWDRLVTWDRHHGYPLEKTKNATNFVVGCTILVIGVAAIGYASLVSQSDFDQGVEPKPPHHK